MRGTVYAHGAPDEVMYRGGYDHSPLRSRIGFHGSKPQRQPVESDQRSGLRCCDSSRLEWKRALVE
jgi:hypothetical protein